MSSNMPTIRQQKVARGLVDNLAAKKPATKQEIVENAGYSHKTATQMSKVIIESEGVKESLVSFGFNENKAKEVVAEILVAGENDTVKLKAAEMIFKVHGTFAPDKHINLNIEQAANSKLDAIVAQIEQQLDEPEGTIISP